MAGRRPSCCPGPTGLPLRGTDAMVHMAQLLAAPCGGMLLATAPHPRYRTRSRPRSRSCCLAVGCARLRGCPVLEWMKTSSPLVPSTFPHGQPHEPNRGGPSVSLGAKCQSSRPSKKPFYLHASPLPAARPTFVAPWARSLVPPKLGINPRGAFHCQQHTHTRGS